MLCNFEGICSKDVKVSIQQQKHYNQNINKPEYILETCGDIQYHGCCLWTQCAAMQHIYDQADNKNVVQREDYTGF